MRDLANSPMCQPPAAVPFGYAAVAGDCAERPHKTVGAGIFNCGFNETQRVAMISNATKGVTVPRPPLVVAMAPTAPVMLIAAPSDGAYPFGSHDRLLVTLMVRARRALSRFGGLVLFYFSGPYSASGKARRDG
jgi:hypothetical protein